MSCHTSNCRVLPNGYDDLANSSGDLVITPTRPNQSYVLTVSGVARTSNIVLSRVRRRAGDIVELLFVLPATADIVLALRNGAVGGDLLLPEEKYTDQLLTTDGLMLSAKMRFVYTGSAWRYLDSQIPA